MHGPMSLHDLKALIAPMGLGPCPFLVLKAHIATDVGYVPLSVR